MISRRDRYGDSAPPELRAEWEQLHVVMPESVRMAVTPELWDQRALHALKLPIQHVAMSDLAWVFDVPLWAVDEVPFQITPNQVRRHPHCFAAQYERTMASDISWPIHIMCLDERWIVLDGVHRLLKAQLGADIIRAMVLSGEDFEGIVFPPDGECR